LTLAWEGYPENTAVVAVQALVPGNYNSQGSWNESNDTH